MREFNWLSKIYHIAEDYVIYINYTVRSFILLFNTQYCFMKIMFGFYVKFT